MSNVEYTRIQEEYTRRNIYILMYIQEVILSKHSLIPQVFFPQY